MHFRDELFSFGPPTDWRLANAGAVPFGIADGSSDANNSLRQESETADMFAFATSN